MGKWCGYLVKRCGYLVVKSDSSDIYLVKKSKLLIFSELNVSDLQWTLTSLDLELDNIKIKVKYDVKSSNYFYVSD